MRYRPIRELLRVPLLILALACVAPGCFLAPPVPPGPPPEISTRYHCTAQLQSADGHVEVVSSLNHLDLTYERAGYRQPIREYATCSGANCPACDYYQSADDVVNEWRDSIDAAVPLFAADPTKVLSNFAAPWCVWPESVTCSPAGLVNTALPGCRPANPETELPHCEGTPPPPPGDQCLEITCNGEPCSGFDFGVVETNVVTSPLRIHVTHCGDALSPPILIVADPDPIDRTTGPSDPGFILSRNGCEGTRNLFSDRVYSGQANCSIDITFASRQEANHEATVIVQSSLPAEHRIGMRAVTVSDAPAGELSFEIPDLPDPSLLPDSLCIVSQGGLCSAERTVRAINTGTVAVEIAAAEIDQPGQGWEVLPSPMPPPRTLFPGEAHDVQVRWCQTNPSADDGLLVITSDATQPQFEQQLTRLPDGSCPPGT